MLHELGLLLETSSAHDGSIESFKRVVIEDNCLGKRSASSRALTFKHLVDLYGLNADQLVFRALRWFWERDESGRPLLALGACLARDSLLSELAPTVLRTSPGAVATREILEAEIDTRFSGRFSPATRKSLAQNINATLTQSGHLSGRAKKRREQAHPTAGSVAYALLLGYASGARGPELFRTRYITAQDVPTDHAIELAELAARKGWIDFKRVADVIGVGFPRIIRPAEQELIHEQG